MERTSAIRGIRRHGMVLAELVSAVDGGTWEPRVYADGNTKRFELVCTQAGRAVHHGRACDAIVTTHEGVTRLRMSARTWDELHDKVSMAQVVALMGKTENWR